MNNEQELQVLEKKLYAAADKICSDEVIEEGSAVSESDLSYEKFSAKSLKEITL